jgi:hypothetical protein
MYAEYPVSQLESILAIILLTATTNGFSPLETSMCELAHCKLLTNCTFNSVVSSTGATCLCGVQRDNFSFVTNLMVNYLLCESLSLLIILRHLHSHNLFP